MDRCLQIRPSQYFLLIDYTLQLILLASQARLPSCFALMFFIIHHFPHIRTTGSTSQCCPFQQAAPKGRYTLNMHQSMIKRKHTSPKLNEKNNHSLQPSLYILPMAIIQQKQKSEKLHCNLVTRNHQLKRCFQFICSHWLSYKQKKHYYHRIRQSL